MPHALDAHVEHLRVAHQHGTQPVGQPEVPAEVREVVHQRPLLHRHRQHFPDHGARPPLGHLRARAFLQRLERRHLGQAVEPQEVVPVRSAEVEATAEREVREPPWPVDEAVRGADRRRERRR